VFRRVKAPAAKSVSIVVMGEISDRLNPVHIKIWAAIAEKELPRM